MRVTMLDTIVLHLAIRSLPCKLLPTVQAGLPPRPVSWPTCGGGGGAGRCGTRGARGGGR